MSNNQPPHRSIISYADPNSGIIWSADHEVGSIAQWNDGGRVALSGASSRHVTTEVAHSGTHALALNIQGANGTSRTTPAARMEWQATGWVDSLDPQNLPDEAFYSVYFFFPQLVKATAWWNVFQWKQSQILPNGRQTRPPVYSIHPIFRGTAMFFRLRQRIGAGGEFVDPAVPIADSNIAIPVGRWVHLEAFYRWSKTANGRISCWQDGQLIFDVQHIRTQFDWPFLQYPRQWTVNNYASETDPPNHTLFIDDAVISLNRVGA